MFSVVAVSALSALAVLVVIHMILRVVAKTPIEERRKYRWGVFEKLIYFGFVFTVCLLAFTSLVSVLSFHVMQGWWLVVHLMGSGAFVIFVAAMSWTVSFRFAMAHLNDQARPNTSTVGFPLSAKIIYWIILITSIVVVSTILLSMFPIFGTNQLLQLIEVHRFSGLALFVAVVLHFLLVTARPHN